MQNWLKCFYHDCKQLPIDQPCHLADIDWSFGGHMAKMMRKYRIDGNKLRDERDKKGFSQEDLEKQTILRARKDERAISVRTISRIETGGNAHPHTISKLADALGIEPEALLTEDKTKQVGKKQPQSGRQLLKDTVVDISLLQYVGTNEKIYGRRMPLNRLNDAWKNKTVNVISVVGRGGFGKTQLINTWLSHMANKNWSGATKILGWTFNGKEMQESASADMFIDYALEKWFPNSGSPPLSLKARGEHLANQIKTHRAILVLDGLELFQYPPGSPQEGQIKDLSLAALIRLLAADNLGLCVITTKYHLSDIKIFWETTAPVIDLQALTDDAGAQLLQNLGVKGSKNVLRKTVQDFGGDPLALNLLGTYLRDVHNGNIKYQSEMNLIEEDLQKSSQIQRIMKSYEDAFKGRSEICLLRILSIFNRPAKTDEITVLRNPPPITGLTEASLKSNIKDSWQKTISNLKKARLIFLKDDLGDDLIDTHRIVREYFAEQLCKELPTTYKQCHERLYKYYKAQTSHLPATLREMAPFFAAIYHGCLVGKQEEVFDDIFLKKIRQGDLNFSVHKLGAWGADIATLSCFFEEPWDKPSTHLKDESKAYVLKEAAFSLWAIGRIKDAIKPMEKALEIYSKNGNFENAARVAGNLSQILTMTGNLTAALELAKKSVIWADKSKNANQRITRRATLANVFHNIGKISEAESYFNESESLQNKEQRISVLYARSGFQHCDFLLDQGVSLVLSNRADDGIRKFQEVQKRAKQTLSWFHDAVIPWLTLNDLALDHLTLGKAYLFEAIYGSRDGFDTSKEHFDEAVEIFRKGGRESFLPYGLLARAALFRNVHKPELAKIDLSDAMEIICASGIKLLKVDCHLEFAKLYLNEDNREHAHSNYENAKLLIQEIGYHRWSKDINELGRQFNT